MDSRPQPKSSVAQGNWRLPTPSRTGTISVAAQARGSPAERNGNWRKRNPQPQRVDQKTQMTMCQGLDPNKAVILTPRNCRVGLIFRAGVHKKNYQDTIPGVEVQEDQFTVKTSCGSVFSKIRIQIVVKIYEKHCETIPLFTHSKSGLQKKSRKERTEFMCVYDPRAPGQFVNESSNKALVVRTNANVRPIDVRSAAKITEPEFPFWGQWIEPMGMLEELSIDDALEVRRERLL